jgi:hypothetical protein
MAQQIFSRAHLQSLPEKLKVDTINKMVDGFILSVQQTATSGKTSYIYDITQPSHINVLKQYYYQSSEYQFAPQRIAPTNMEGLSETIIPMTDIISQIQGRFPGCRVSYQETWVDVSSNTRIAKKGILIDWS